MGTETFLIETCSNGDTFQDYGCFGNNGPPDLLTQWLNSLETRTSLFWLHYVECNFKNNSEEACKFREKLGSEESASLSSSSLFTEETVSDFDSLKDSNSSTSSIEQSSLLYTDDNSLKEVPIIPCKSIAHRDSELLVALSENCSHGPVCYFCR